MVAPKGQTKLTYLEGTPAFFSVHSIVTGRVAELEQSERQLRETLMGKEKDLERLRHEVAKLQLNGSEAFTKEEKEALKAKIKEMIAKA